MSECKKERVTEPTYKFVLTLSTTEALLVQRAIAERIRNLGIGPAYEALIEVLNSLQYPGGDQ